MNIILSLALLAIVLGALAFAAQPQWAHGCKAAAKTFVENLRIQFFTPLIRIANTVTIGDADVEEHPCTVRRSAEEALTARHLIVKKGTADGQVLIAGASDVGIGTVDNIVAIDEAVTVKLFGKGGTKKVVASGAIGAGVKVYQAASGQVASSGTVCRGISLTAALAAGDTIELNDHIESGDSPGVAASTYDAHTILYATTDNTPVALTVGASTIVGRKASGNISAMSAAESHVVVNGGVANIAATPVAAAGTTVADAGALTLARSTYITSDGATKGVKLATTAAGQWGFVINGSGTAAEFYAASGGTVNGLSADASVVIPASKGILWFATAADTIIAFDLPAKATAS